MKKIEIYEYPPLIKIVGLVAPVFLLILIGLLLALPWQNSDLSLDPLRYGLILLVAIPIAILFALSIHFMYPDIHTREDEFKLVTRFYESDWISWGSISRVLIPETRLTSQIYTVAVVGLHPIYRFIGLTRGLMTPAFLIHPNLRRGERLLRTLIQKRPDLFPPPRS